MVAEYTRDIHKKQEQNMSSLDNIFLAYDVRGKVGIELTTEVSRDIGKALADWLPNEGPVAVGRDMRPDSAELAQALIEGLREQGRDVIDIGQVTSDMIYFAVGSLNLAGGAMVTASHNPGEYNGIKFCREEAKPIGIESGLLDIKKACVEQSFDSSSTKGAVEQKDITEEWITHVLSFVEAENFKPLKIAVDAGNGMAGAIFPEIEPYLPFEVTELFFEPDGTFPNHIANPLEPKNLIDLQKEMQTHAYAAGVAFDGDGDRAVLLDEHGEPLSGTVMSALLAEFFLKKNPGSTILLNAICGKAAYDAVEKNGGKAVRTKVGHSFIKAEMRNNDAVFAGEHSGHYYFRDNFCADSGLIAAVIALYILSNSGKPLSELARVHRDAYAQATETNFQVNDKDKTLADIKDTFSNNKQNNLDGLTVELEKGWFNVRPSNTEPLLRLNAEAENKQELEKIVTEVTKIIEV
jgi:phosphomannomutase